MEFRVQLEPYKNKWRVLRRIALTLQHNKHPALKVDIPRRFITDLDSVPRLPLMYSLFKNRTIVGALFHDWMYQKQINRKRADDYFLMLMRYEGVKKRYRYPIYLAVRLFGGARYAKKRGMKA